MTLAILARAHDHTVPTGRRPVRRLATLAVAGLVLLTATSAFSQSAGTLYRWSEPDGSLTFSPTAPTDGTPYEAVDPMTMKPPESGPAKVEPAPVEPARATSAEAARGSAPTVRTSSAARIDPVTSTRPSPAAPPTMGAAIRFTPDTLPRPADPDESSPTARGASTAAREKQRRCGELEKRIVSLERRLAAPLTPEAMDDTVIQMARYQQNVDRHCR